MSEISGQYRAVIIGGGILGVSTLYHLAQEGWRDVLLIEKGEISSGSTWHAAGQCPHFVDSYSLMKIHDYGIKTYANMPQKLGHSAGWHGCGGIRLAYSEAEVSWFKYIAGIAKLIGVEFAIIPPEEIRTLHPFLNLNGVIAGAQTFTDGHTDPSSAANGFAAGAKALGAKISLRNRVIRIERQKDCWSIETEHGCVSAEHVVNAAGSYGDAVARLVGIRVPLSNMMHQYVVTETIPELQERTNELPVVRDPSCHAYLRQEQKGLLIGPYENQGAQIVWGEQNHPHWDFEMELLPEDLERIAPWLESAVERLPLFGTIGIKRVISGAITHSPDGNFLAGPAARLRNFWHCTGAGIGIAQGPGIGKYLSQWMIHGEAEINMAAFDPRRFGDWAVGDYSIAKSVDDYEHMYALHHPDVQRPAGRPVRTSALDTSLRDKGAEMTEVHGWERPLHYGGKGLCNEYGYGRNADFDQIVRECHAVRDSAGLVDLSSFACFRIRGSDSAVFLDSLTPTRLPRVGRARLCHLLNENATFLAEWTIIRLQNDDFLIFSGASAEASDAHLLSCTQEDFSGDVMIENSTEALGSLLITGPNARAILAEITDSDLSTAALPWMAACLADIARHSAVLVRMSYAGAQGYEIHCDPQHLPSIHEALYATAQAQNLSLAPVGMKALNTLRLEKAFPAFGSELTNEVTFLEAGLHRFWQHGKTAFRGRDALLREHDKPQRWALRYLALDRETVSAIGADAMGNEPIYAGDTLVGLTTSGGYGARVEQSLAFGYVRPEAVDSELIVQIQQHPIPARTLNDPSFDPDFQQIRA